MNKLRVAQGITLRPIEKNEFASFVTYFIEDYTAEIVTNYRLSEPDARAQAIRDVEQSFPDAERTPDQIVLCIMFQQDDTEHHVGYIWYKADTVLKSVYINDFYLFEASRNKGFGSAAMKALENKLSQEGFTQMKLRVAQGNEHARHLYSANGFSVTGINMNKLL